MTGKHGSKIVATIDEALAPLRDGMTIMVGGFGLSGNPEALIRGVVERGVRDLTLISNNAYGVLILGGTSATFDRCTVAFTTNNSIAAIETQIGSSSPHVTSIVSSIVSHNASYGVRRYYSYGTVNVSNTDVWGNSGSFGPPPTASANTSSANYLGSISQTNNNSENPLFADTSTRNYTLQSTSPCRGSTNHATPPHVVCQTRRNPPEDSRWMHP